MPEPVIVSVPIDFSPEVLGSCEPAALLPAPLPAPGAAALLRAVSALKAPVTITPGGAARRRRLVAHLGEPPREQDDEGDQSGQHDPPDLADAAGVDDLQRQQVRRDGQDPQRAFGGPCRLWRFQGGCHQAAPRVRPIETAAVERNCSRLSRLPRRWSRSRLSGSAITASTPSWLLSASTRPGSNEPPPDRTSLVTRVCRSPEVR